MQPYCIPLYKTNVIIPIFKARTGPFRISVLSKYVPSPSQTYRHGRCRRIAVGLLRQGRRRKPPRKRVCPGRHDRSRLQRFGRRGADFRLSRRIRRPDDAAAFLRHLVSRLPGGAARNRRRMADGSWRTRL